MKAHALLKSSPGNTFGISVIQNITNAHEEVSYSTPSGGLNVLYHLTAGIFMHWSFSTIQFMQKPVIGEPEKSANWYPPDDGGLFPD